MVQLYAAWPLSKARLLLIAAVFVAALVPAVLATEAAAAAPYDYGFDVHEQLSRRSLTSYNPNTPFVVSGIASGSGSGSQQGSSKPRVFPRQEIRQMEKNADLWTLYILGLSMMQYTPQSQLLSYYQIAGIHGVPWIEWNGVAPKPGSENTGYCTHVSELFLTWHRPYLALYEQVLFSLVEYIASLYKNETERARYQAAAARFRIPYMDWAAQPPAGESVLPNSVGSSPYVTVSGPNGVQRIANPLYTYMFKPLNTTMFIENPYDLWVTTVRSPTTQDASAGSNNTAVSLALNQNFPSIQQRLYTLFSNYHNFSTFSNEAWIPTSSSGNYDSLESLHDTIHTLMGLQGHMSWIPFSSFDPIFFLHHCMIDRVFALWQILNPDSWVIPTKAVLASYTTSEGEIQDAQTPLTPFYKTANGTFWTSDDIRDMGVLGYTYDDMMEYPRSSLLATNATTQGQVGALINRLYGPSSPATLGILSDKSYRRSVFSVFSNSSGPAQPHGLLEPPHRAPSSVVVNNMYREWVANIHAPKQALNNTFFVDLFLGGDHVPAGDPSAWAYAPALVGTMSVFASPGGLSNMAGMDMSGGHTSGVVPLTSALAQKVASGDLASLEPDAVEPYLHRFLHCGVVTTDGTEVAPHKVPGLGVTIASSSVQVPTSADELPRWGAVTDHFDLV